MTLAAVPVRRKDRNLAVAGEPEARQPSLAERLAEAQRAADGPAERVSELETQLQEALDGQDYAAADSVNAQLEAARQEHAIAAAMVTALQGALTEMDRQRRDDRAAIDRQQLETEARAEIERQRQVFREAQEESARLRETIAAGVAAVKQTIAEMLASDGEAAEATRVMSERRQLLGEGPLGAPFSPAKHLLETDRLIADIWNRRDPIDGKAWPR
jgi:septal ring factor EnvC (AmiA/AmiB activator)